MTRDEHIARHGSLYSGNEIKAHNKRIAAKKMSTSDGYMPRKLEVKSVDTSKDEARLKMSKTTKRGKTSFGGQAAKKI